MKRVSLINVLLQLVLLFVLVLSAPANEKKGQVYIVQTGDRMPKLAERFYSDPFAWPAIWEATNNLAEFE